MAFRDLTRGLKNFFGPNNRFFNGIQEEDTAEDYSPAYGAQPAAASPHQEYSQPQQGYNPAQQGYAQSQPVYNQPQQGYVQPQPAYSQQQGYAQPAYNQPQQGYMPPQQPYIPVQPGYSPPRQERMQPQASYSQPQQAPQYRTPAGYQQPLQNTQDVYQRQTVDQPYMQPRSRRSAQHTRQRENVVPFPGGSMPDPQMPSQQPIPQQDIPRQAERSSRQISTCVINVRSIADCRSAIGILLSGDCVIAVMDSIADQSEVRRYVDTLNGACYSLNCTMTRTSSRVGVYFLAPADMRVLTDQTTTQMNSQSRAPQRPRSGQSIFQSPWSSQQRGTSGQSSQPAYGQQDPYAARQPMAYSQPSAQNFEPRQPAQVFVPDQNNPAGDQDPSSYAQDAL
ncbi:MAG: cell division protein SepF [Clostridia bacterium]|nr:cell division protein SepF [Clostridia bacterium]